MQEMQLENAPSLPAEARTLLQKITTAWLGKIQTSLTSKKRLGYDSICNQIDHFYSGTMGFMYRDEFRQRYTGDAIKPKFQITISKAYELVSLFGPALYYRNPTRTVRPFKGVEFGPEILGNPEDPQVIDQYNDMMQTQSFDDSRAELRADLLETYLSYTPREQPDGGLEQAAEDAITEALLYGRGTLWSEPFTMPGSKRKLTGSFHYPTKDLIIDPDCTKFTFGNARWIARRCVAAHWELEREYGLKPGALLSAATGQSGNARGTVEADELREINRERGKSHDMVTYYKVWSIGGVGTRLSGMDQHGQAAFDNAIGDYAYMVVTPGYPTPLNCPIDKFTTATPEEVGEMFSWPIPYWLDRRWPVSVLDFTFRPGSPYPICPMEPGLGELVFINVLISTLAGRAWEDSRTIIAFYEDMAEEIEAAVKGADQTVLMRLKRNSKLLRENVDFLTNPELKGESWMMLEKAFELFDKRVGLSELWYSMNSGAASRTATDVQAKESKASIRPDHMAKQVDKWMASAAQMEKMCAYFSHVSGDDVKHLLGSVGAQLWDQLVTTEEVEVIVRETDASVESNSSKKPNRERDLYNLGQMYTPMSQQLDGHANATGDTTMINNLNERMFEALEGDFNGLAMGERKPPEPSPEEQQQQMQMQQQAEQEQMQQQQQMQMQATQFDQSMEQATFQAEQGRKQAEHAQAMQQDQEAHDQDLLQDEQEAQAKLRHQDALTRLSRIQTPRNAKNA